MCERYVENGAQRCLSKKDKWVIELLTSGMRPQLVILEEISVIEEDTYQPSMPLISEESRLREYFHMDRLMREGANLLNSHMPMARDQEEDGSLTHPSLVINIM